MVALQPGTGPIARSIKKFDSRKREIIRIFGWLSLHTQITFLRLSIPTVLFFYLFQISMGIGGIVPILPPCVFLRVSHRAFTPVRIFQPKWALFHFLAWIRFLPLGASKYGQQRVAWLCGGCTTFYKQSQLLQPTIDWTRFSSRCWVSTRWVPVHS